MDDQFSTPILLLIFNRPQATTRVIEHLRNVKPSILYVGADGPRQDKLDDKVKCNNARLALNNIDWPCEIITLFRDENLGCRNAVNNAIDWFFSHVEAGIILEDDCLPDVTFFSYASVLLEKYKDAPKIMHIAGDNPIEHLTYSLTSSYTFVSMPLVWGWATWRSAWQKMNLNLDGLEIYNFSRLPLNKLSQNYIKAKFIDTKSQINDSWAYAWYFSILQHEGLCILPKVNLVKNIGFNEESTHTKKNNKKREISSHSLDFPLIHPDAMVQKYDQELFYGAQKSKIGLLIRHLLPKWLQKN